MKIKSSRSTVFLKPIHSPVPFRHGCACFHAVVRHGTG